MACKRDPFVPSVLCQMKLHKLTVEARRKIVLDFLLILLRMKEVF